MKHLIRYNQLNESKLTFNPEVKDILNIITDEGIEMVYSDGADGINFRTKYYIIVFNRPDSMEPAKFYDICKDAYDRLKYNDHLHELDNDIFEADGVFGTIYLQDMGDIVPVDDFHLFKGSDITRFNMFINRDDILLDLN